MKRIRDLEDLLEFAAANPGVAHELKRDPGRIAALLEVPLSDEESRLISEKLDLDALLSAAETADTMAMKVAQGVGLRTMRGESAE